MKRRKFKNENGFEDHVSIENSVRKDDIFIELTT